MDNANLPFIAAMIHTAYKIPVCLLDEQQHVLQSSGSQLFNPLYKNKNEFFLESVQPERKEKNNPVLVMTTYKESLIVFHLTSGNMLVLGPFTVYEETESIIDAILDVLTISKGQQEKLIAYYNRLPFLSQRELLALCRLAFYLIFHKQLDPDRILSQLREPDMLETEPVEDLLRQRRFDATFHMEYRDEQKIWQYIKEGNKEGLQQHIETIDIDGVGVLSKKSQLRNMKNHSIISIALATRAAIEGGLYPEIAYTMSDLSIQKIEDTSEPNKIQLIVNDHFYSLIDQIRDNKSSSFSKAVQICQNYIFNHIFEPIQITDLAEIVHLNPVYLSQLFKKETSMPLGKYIQSVRLEEAQKLLVQTDYSVAEICMMLQFNDQSYFCSIFKKHTGLTPKQYRKNPVLN
ncbi:helix-turn-helix domain-containing protein [Terribacillus saccharophilus]|uniref:helix-turn-helix domain-containing protein n=1 Tax=Terribacillus saccharophilus TaxID=361277 RepID=UPI003982C32D